MITTKKARSVQMRTKKESRAAGPERKSWSTVSAAFAMGTVFELHTNIFSALALRSTSSWLFSVFLREGRSIGLGGPGVRKGSLEHLQLCLSTSRNDLDVDRVFLFSLKAVSNVAELFLELRPPSVYDVRDGSSDIGDASGKEECEDCERTHSELRSSLTLSCNFCDSNALGSGEMGLSYPSGCFGVVWLK